ncbi:MAG TPA: DEAD/DEAH box helicase [Oligoflexia bacterium]|nr:DEAD/DEAH box helicase [Oligoflexia bacterium]HMP48042.1 DEAD/DEAH box helicase [Oligoflexia bacterium]
MFKLRPYQEEASRATLDHFRRSKAPAVIVLPTGAGKSLIIAELARIARGRVLVLAHVKELVEQNYSKFGHYGLSSGIYSAGLGRKESNEKVIFGSIQSVARADKSFFIDFSLLVIDECHRVSLEEETQYQQVISELLTNRPDLCVLGLTATPFRIDSGWIYQYHHKGTLRSSEPRLFTKCIYELTLQRMIDEGYLTPPVQIDAPVASYDFSSLQIPSGSNSYRLEDIEAILKDQKRITPVIVQNIIELSKERKGVLIFTASIRHAKEILTYLPSSSSRLIVGDTPGSDRDEIVQGFKNGNFKYLVNVSVLTTGFDAPHVDLIAILRPTESVSLYQQIVGRGLRLYEGKKDCLILDYTGVPHDIFSPRIGEKKPTEDSVPVEVKCPMCTHVNEFWGLKDDQGNVVEHFGRTCKGVIEATDGTEIVPCGFRYRYRTCDRCGCENDIASRECSQCSHLLVDNDTKLQEAMSLKDAHVMRPDTMTFEKKVDKSGRERLEVRYYDLDAQHLSEVFYFETRNDEKVFYYNFIRMHNRLPERSFEVKSIDEAISMKDRFRMPLYVIARKQKHFWRVREKIFN